MPLNVVACVLVCNNSKGTGFGSVSNAFCRVYAVGPEGVPMPELCRSMPGRASGAHQGMVLGVLYRIDAQTRGWTFQAAAAVSDGVDWEKAMPEVLATLAQAINVVPSQRYVPGNRFIMTKGQTVDFEASHIRAGLGWDVSQRASLDLDLDVPLG
eukprot:TRINITY_DN3426_c0_g2_i1.p1 TRINITY_DN3426_c0_g2~~TRINITY_DN3426_c0_g2_i1.p1  ORF type:complete len:155 (-),score=22.37 TRINITY_DN3426_c0_g2_i1:29-493(-)